MHVVGVLAKALALNVGNLGYVAAVAGSGLHDDVKSGHFGVVSYKSTDTESCLGLALKVSADIGSLLKIKAVAEQQSLGQRIDTKGPALNIVMKTTACNGCDVAKISDVEGKSLCKNPDYVHYLKRCIEWRMNNETGDSLRV